MPEENGFKVFVVEDEALVAMMIEDILLDLGCTVVASAVRLHQAQDIAETIEVDFAVLDVNLAGQTVFPVAEILERRGIPFLFSTGYGARGLPPALADRPVLNKPYSSSQLQQAIALILPG